jgi:outer membrane lipoprotein-sorting protein
MTINRKTFIAGLFALTMAAPPAPANALSAAGARAVDDISGFFNSFHTLSGEFTQISPRGRVSTGKFYIAKPGRMRFEYSPPNPFVIVSDGTWVAVRNNARDTVDYYPLSKTPLRMVLAKRVDLKRDAIIHKVEKREGLTIVTLEDRDKMVPGHLVLVYDDARKTLQQWIVVDGQGRRTTVSLNNLRPGVKVAAKLFRVKRAGTGKKVRKKTNFNSVRHK